MKPVSLAGIALLAVLAPACGDSGRVKVAPLPVIPPPTRAAYAALATETCRTSTTLAVQTQDPPPDNVFDSAAVMAQVDGTAKGYVAFLNLQKPPPADSAAVADYLAKIEASYKAALDTITHYQQKETQQALADTAVWVVRLRAANAAGAALGFQCGLPSTILSESLSATDAEAQSRLNAVGGAQATFFRAHNRYTPYLAAELYYGRAVPISVAVMLPDPAPAVPASTATPASTSPSNQLFRVMKTLCLRAAASTGRIWYVTGNEGGLMSAPSVNPCEAPVFTPK